MSLFNMMGKMNMMRKGSKGGRIDGLPQVATVRYEDADTAQRAVEQLNGSSINGTPIQVALDHMSKDGTKIKVSNIPSEAEWQEVKDHFKTVGKVAFADVGAGRNGGPPQIATVRYEDADSAQRAVEQLNGSSINGTSIQVELDYKSKDGTKIKVSNIPSEAEWQEVKDHFRTVGTVAFADVKGSGKGGCVGGTVRYNTSQEAMIAIATFNGTEMNGHMIELKMHSGTKDQTKIQIFGMPPGTEWQELKDHFGQVGQIAFAEAYNPEVEHTGVIRYDDPSHAQLALKMLNGSLLGGVPICIELDQMSRDSTRLVIHGIPSGIELQELKDHFKQIGTVAFSEVKGGGKGGSGKAGGMGTRMNLQMMQMLVGLTQMQGTGMMGGGRSYGQDHFKPFVTLPFGCGKGGFGKMGGMQTSMNPEMMQMLAGMMQMQGPGVMGGGKSYGQSKGSYRGSPYGGDGTADVIANFLQGMGMNEPLGSDRVFVHGFDFGTTENQLRAHMGMAGRILQVQWYSPGSAEVIYETSAAAEAALSLDKSTIWGNTRFINVLQA